MLNKLKKTRGQKGFTIIEVMIVLAIAGLILLIVFLAVPALQRTARNTQRKNDAAQISAAISSFVSNNGGALPTAVGTTTSDVNSIALYCKGATPANVTATQDVTASTGCTATNNNSENAKLGYYKPTDKNVFMASVAQSTIIPGASSSTPTANNITTESVTIDIGYGCNTTSTDVGTANSRSAAVLYVTEGGTNGSLQCVEE